MASHEEQEHYKAGESQGRAEERTGITETVEEKAREAKDKTHETIQQAEERAAQTTESAKQKAQESQDKTEGVLQQTGEKVKHMAESATETVKHTLGMGHTQRDENKDVDAPGHGQTTTTTTTTEEPKY